MMMDDIEKVIEGLEDYEPYARDLSNVTVKSGLFLDALELLKKMKSTIGMKIDANGMVFTATGDAQKGEERGLALGQAMMREKIEREIIRRGLMSDSIREVFKTVSID